MKQQSMLVNNPWDKPAFGTARWDMEHPLGRGMVAAYLFNEMGGFTCFSAMPKFRAPFGTPNVRYTIGRNGNSAISFNGSQTAANCPTIQANSQLQLARTAYTLCARVRINVLATSKEIVECNGNTGWRCRIDNNNVFSVVYNPGVTVLVATTALAVGLWYDVAFSTGLPGGSGGRVYTNGVQEASNATTGTGSGSVVNPVIGQSPAFNEPMNGDIEYLYIYEIGMTPANLKWLAMEPYAMFQSITGQVDNTSALLVDMNATAGMTDDDTKDKITPLVDFGRSLDTRSVSVNDPEGTISRNLDTRSKMIV